MLGATVSGDDFDGQQVIDAEAVLTHQPADAAAQRESRNPGVRHRAARGGEAVDLGFAVEVGPKDATLGAGGAGDGVNVDALHAREVDLHAALGGAIARSVVRPAADGHEEVL